MARQVLIFGGGRGIGAEVGRAFGKLGDRVTLVARGMAQVQATAREIGAAAEVADVGDARAVDAVLARAGRVDVVVNAAAIQGGAGAIGALDETDPAAFAEVVRVNLLGTYHVLRAALRSFAREHVDGAVICFSGGGAVFPRPGFAAYAATKTAVLRLVETAHKELRERGAPGHVFAVAPGAVRTAMTDEVLALGARAGAAETQAAQKIAAGEGTPPGLAAELCVFLASPAAARLGGRLVHVKEPYRELAKQELSRDAGCLRRRDY